MQNLKKAGWFAFQVCTCCVLLGVVLVIFNGDENFHFGDLMYLFMSFIPVSYAFLLFYSDMGDGKIQNKTNNTLYDSLFWGSFCFVF